VVRGEERAQVEKREGQRKWEAGDEMAWRREEWLLRWGERGTEWECAEEWGWEGLRELAQVSQGHS
jgi:hypothetical protein